MPTGRWLRLPDSLRCGRIRVSTSRSRTFEIVFKFEIGRKLAGTLLSRPAAFSATAWFVRSWIFSGIDHLWTIYSQDEQWLDRTHQRMTLITKLESRPSAMIFPGIFSNMPITSASVTSLKPVKLSPTKPRTGKVTKAAIDDRAALMLSRSSVQVDNFERTRGHSKKLIKDSVRLDTRKSWTDRWSLNEEVASAGTADTFKKRLENSKWRRKTFLMDWCPLSPRPTQNLLLVWLNQVNNQVNKSNF